MKEVFVLVAIKLDKPVADIVSHVAGRVYTMDGVNDAHAILVDDEVGKSITEASALKDNQNGI